MGSIELEASLFTWDPIYSSNATEQWVRNSSGEVESAGQLKKAVVIGRYVRELQQFLMIFTASLIIALQVDGGTSNIIIKSIGLPPARIYLTQLPISLPVSPLSGSSDEPSNCFQSNGAVADLPTWIRTSATF